MEECYKGYPYFNNLTYYEKYRKITNNEAKWWSMPESTEESWCCFIQLSVYLGIELEHFTLIAACYALQNVDRSEN